MRSLIQSSNAEAYSTLSQAIASASVPEYEKITCPLLCVAGQEDQVARLEDLALIGDRHVSLPSHPSHYRIPTFFPWRPLAMWENGEKKKALLLRSINVAVR